MRIVVRASDVRAAREAQSQLAAAGVEAAALPGPLRAAPDGEDIAIFPNVADAPLAEALRKSATPPLACLSGQNWASPSPLGLYGVPPFAGALSLDAPPKLLAAQVEAWTRVAVAEEERTRRVATGAGFNVPAPQLTEVRRLRALYIGAPSSMFLALERALADQGGVVAAAFSSYAGFDHLHDDIFDAVVLNGAQDPATAISLCAALRRNASLFHLPTMVVVASGDTTTAKSAIDRGASSVATVNAPCGPSLGWLFEAVRRERRRRSAENEMRALCDLMGDFQTGLWQRPNFDAHLARLASDHHISGRPLSLAALRVLPAHGARAPAEDVWRKGVTEVASLAARLMRDTDCGVTLGSDLIVVALPASQLKTAKRTAERIASVAECTAFASGDGSAGPLVFEQSAVELQPGESGAGMLARALRAIDYELMSQPGN